MMTIGTTKTTMILLTVTATSVHVYEIVIDAVLIEALLLYPETNNV